jgi:alanine dehydrogenase
VAQIADKGYEKALEENEALNKGLNLLDGKVICSGVAETFGLTCTRNPFVHPRP